MSSLVEDTKGKAGRQKSPRPDVVPRLELSEIIKDNPEEQKLEDPIKKSKSLHTPASNSTVSWGTPLSTPYALTQKDIEFGGTVYRPCTHMRHRPDSRKQQRNPITHKVQVIADNPPLQTNKQMNVEVNKKVDLKGFAKEKQKVTIAGSPKRMTKSPKAQNPKSKSTAKKGDYWYLDDHLKPKSPSPEPEDGGYSVDEMAQMQAEYTEQPYTDLHDARKSAAEEDLSKKQREEVMEQVLVDQLSRHVISDAEQDRDPARQNPANPASAFNTAPLRFKSRRLHDTKVSTAGAVTESKLKDRITFSARLLTRNGRDALRDLFGFYFHTDQTLTVYEYRLFGKNTSKALPVIERGKYSHVAGRRKGKSYCPVDFQVGKNLSFSTKKQPALPDSLRKTPTILLRVYDSSASASSVGNWDIPSSDRDGGSDTALERNDRKITQNVQKFVRSKLRDRSVSVLVGLGQLFRSLDVSGDGMLSKDELSEALYQFKIKLPDQDFEAVWRVVDENNDGAIDYGEFMRAFIGEMNETRKQFVRKVFKKLDPHKTGYANLLDLQKLYSAKKHPLVTAGNFSQSEMEDQFIKSFSDICTDREGRVSFVEFVDYYEGTSILIESDASFINMMRNCWGV